MPIEDFTSVYRTNPDPFLNSKCLFVEFMDLIAMPWYNILRFSATSEQMHEVYPFTEFDPTDDGECLEWYVNRKDRNIFKSLNVYKTANLPSSFPDDVLHTLEKSDKYIFLSAPQLAFHNVINNLIHGTNGKLLSKSLVGKIIIYSETEIPFIKEYLEKSFGKPSYLTYVHGDLPECIKEIPNDTTFAFSDITKVNVLKECNKLDFSSIIVSDNYRYNYDKDYKPLVDIEAFRKDHIFKYDLVDVFKIVK